MLNQNSLCAILKLNVNTDRKKGQSLFLVNHSCIYFMVFDKRQFLKFSFRLSDSGGI